MTSKYICEILHDKVKNIKDTLLFNHLGTVLSNAIIVQRIFLFQDNNVPMTSFFFQSNRVICVRGAKAKHQHPINLYSNY